MTQLDGAHERIVGFITLTVGRWYLRKRLKELRGPLIAGAAVTAGVIVLGSAAARAQQRRSRFPPV